jgi:hypothetical protein
MLKYKYMCDSVRIYIHMHKYKQVIARKQERTPTAPGRSASEGDVRRIRK